MFTGGGISVGGWSRWRKKRVVIIYLFGATDFCFGFSLVEIYLHSTITVAIVVGFARTHTQRRAATTSHEPLRNTRGFMGGVFTSTKHFILFWNETSSLSYGRRLPAPTPPLITHTHTHPGSFFRASRLEDCAPDMRSWTAGPPTSGP